jgi:ubiquinone/menaquinone biosynthesis C-methylase UbiE
MPYFDLILERIAAGDQALTAALGHHVHWGYWAAPSPGSPTAHTYPDAAEAMTRRICDAAGVRPRMRVLDVGCGFGGTVGSLNTRLDRMDIVGVNIDPRQLARARETVQARPGNAVRFVEADATALPFPAASFDAVVAVECIFHFPGRVAFLREARRVLAPGGRLAISDFVPYGPTVPLLIAAVPLFAPAVARVYGRGNTLCTAQLYRLMARRAGLRVVHDEDITRETLPTYPALQALQAQFGAHGPAFSRATRNMELLARSGLLRYRILGFA